MADLQIKGNKIALIDSSDNIVYTLPDSAGALGKALVSDGAGELIYGGINIDSVLATGNTANRGINVDTLTVNTLNTSKLFNQQSQTFSFQGSTSGYASGGNSNGTRRDTIDKFPFSSDANATDVGDLTQRRDTSAGSSSSTHGYTAGGNDPTGAGPTQPSHRETIDKFSFASDGNATDVGDISDGPTALAAGTSSATNGYIIPGKMPPIAIGARYIEKFPFATDANSREVSFHEDRTTEVMGGHSSNTHGYSSGGRVFPSFGGNPFSRVPIDDITKFSMVVDTLLSDVGDLTEGTSSHSAQSSTTHGYATGGFPNFKLKIQKFSFASDGNAADIANLSMNVGSGSGQSSTTNGYDSGGSTPPSTEGPRIQKFPFATDADATEVGDLTQGRSHSAEQQV